MMTLDGQNCLLAHPLKGLALNNILDIIRDSKKSVVLTNIMHNLSTICGTLFPVMHTAVETFSTLQSDVLVLFGYELDK